MTTGRPIYSDDSLLLKVRNGMADSEYDNLEMMQSDLVKIKSEVENSHKISLILLSLKNGLKDCQTPEEAEDSFEEASEEYKKKKDELRQRRSSVVEIINSLTEEHNKVAKNTARIEEIEKKIVAAKTKKDLYASLLQSVPKEYDTIYECIADKVERLSMVRKMLRERNDAALASEEETEEIKNDCRNVQEKIDRVQQEINSSNMFDRSMSPA